MEKRTMIAAAFAACLIPSTDIVAQTEVETTVGADLVSGYVWRGQDMGSSAIQPSLGISMNGLSLSAWGSYGLTDKSDTNELDFTLGYAMGSLSVGLTDYFVTTGSAISSINYFDYKSATTTHVFEASLGYDFGVLSATWFTNIAGADSRTSKGKRAYSSYVEVSAPFHLGGLDMTATAGIVPFETAFYQTTGDLQVVNLSLTASKDVRLSNTFSLPLFASITANPSSRKCFLTAGVSF